LFISQKGMFSIQQHLLKIAFKSELIIYGAIMSVHSFISQKVMFSDVSLVSKTLNFKLSIRRSG